MFPRTKAARASSDLAPAFGRGRRRRRRDGVRHRRPAWRWRRVRSASVTRASQFGLRIARIIRTLVARSLTEVAEYLLAMAVTASVASQRVNEGGRRIDDESRLVRRGARRRLRVSWFGMLAAVVGGDRQHWLQSRRWQPSNRRVTRRRGHLSIAGRRRDARRPGPTCGGAGRRRATRTRRPTTPTATSSSCSAARPTPTVPTTATPGSGTAPRRPGRSGRRRQEPGHPLGPRAGLRPGRSRRRSCGAAGSRVRASSSPACGSGTARRRPGSSAKPTGGVEPSLRHDHIDGLRSPIAPGPWSSAAWTRPAPASTTSGSGTARPRPGPSGRSRARSRRRATATAAIYDAFRKRIVVYGGNTGSAGQLGQRDLGARRDRRHLDPVHDHGTAPGVLQLGRLHPPRLRRRHAQGLPLLDGRLRLRVGSGHADLDQGDADQATAPTRRLPTTRR